LIAKDRLAQRKRSAKNYHEALIMSHKLSITVHASLKTKRTNKSSKNTSLQVGENT